MINTHLKLPFTWYKNIELQNSYKSATKGDSCYRLITPNATMLPFLIRDAAILKATPVTDWKVYRPDGTIVVDLTSQAATLLTYYRTLDDTFGYIQHKGQIAFAVALECGFYYSKITKDGVDFFSEIFYVSAGFDASNYMKLEVWHGCDIGSVLFQKGYKSIVYLEAEIERVKHEIYEEGVEDGYKRFFPTVQVFKQMLRFDEFCPDYMAAALTCFQMCENIMVTTKGGFETTAAENFKTVVSWEENAASALVECTFMQEEDLMRTGCCKNMLLEI